MRTEKDMENPMENATDEEMSDKDMQDYNIACGISIALGIVADAKEGFYQMFCDLKSEIEEKWL